MQEASEHPVSLEAYFQLDAESEARLEYWGGQIVAMAGESRNHAIVKDDVIRCIERQRPDCLALTAGLRVYAPGYGRQNYAYPDGLLVCGEERYDDNQPPTLLNPALLLEVTSPTTKSTDFDDKFGAYFKIESLREYWIIDPERAYVRQCIKAQEGVLVRLVQDLTANLDSEALGLSVPLAEVYRRIHM